MIDYFPGAALFCFSCLHRDQKLCITANNLPIEVCPKFSQKDIDNGIKEWVKLVHGF